MSDGFSYIENSTQQLLPADIPPVRTSPENSDIHKKQWVSDWAIKHFVNII